MVVEKVLVRVTNFNLDSTLAAFLAGLPSACSIVSSPGTPWLPTGHI